MNCVNFYIMDKTSPSPETVSARVIVKGIVQGVYFRASTRDMAKRHSVYGWVRNNKDGSVEAVFEGGRKNVESALDWCKQGPPGARVDNTRVSWQEKIENFKSFHIDYESF